MTSLAEEIAIRLLIAEEQAQFGNRGSITNLTGQSAPPPVQAPTQENLSISVGKRQYFTISKDNLLIPSSGVIADLTASPTRKIYLNKISFATATEWNLLKLSIDAQLFKEGNFTFFEDLGYAYYDPNEALYHFSVVNAKADVRFTMGIDTGITLTTLIIDYYTQ